ncbi:MAG TPA: prenyltransferase/squalene oxidase repeat-containing protein [Bryobacteraceae bacterium]|jgi:squalene cyclase|nr:prenyltransferase/squalene oxidase repeat-containing protein [Bryobacteraceae bacterium]
MSLLDFAKRQGNSTFVKALLEAGVADTPAGLPPTQPDRKTTISPQAAIAKSIPVLQRSDAVFLRKAGCVSCHNNSLTAMALASVRPRGASVDEQLSRETLARTLAYLQENRERALENEGLPGAADTVSYILLGMAAAKYPGDSTTEIWARYLKDIQCADGHWTSFRIRPPLESSDMETTAVSIRAMQTYGLKSQKAVYSAAARRAVRWLETNTPTDTEDHVFQILGLLWGGGNRGSLRKAAHALLAMQRPDGGWGQTSVLPSDAYATGQSRWALRESGVISSNNAAYQRGVQYLLNSQMEDGSWHVKTRAPAFQPWFDSEFPHAGDQFISAAATNWAVMALSSAAL